MSLLYIGAGLDTSILKCELPDNVNMFIFVDSRPKTEWGTVSGVYNPLFMKELKEAMKKVGFSKVKRYILKEKGEEKNRKKNEKNGKYEKYEHKGVVIFMSKNKKRVVYYFYSTIFSRLHINSQLDGFISSCNYLYINGHEPEDDVIENMAKPIVFIGSDSTVYTREKNSVFAPHERIDEKFLFHCMAKHKDDVKKWYELESASLFLKEVDYEWFFADHSEADFMLY